MKKRYSIYATGVGRNEKEAKKEAYKNLADQREIEVYNNFNKYTELYQKNHRSDYSNKIISNTRIVANEKIKFTRIVDKYYTKDGNHHILVSIDTEALDNFNKMKTVEELVKK